MRPRLALLVAVAALLPIALAARADWRSEPPEEGPLAAPVRSVRGVPSVAINDLARLLGASKFWDGARRRMTLRVGERELVFVEDAPFTTVAGTTFYLGAPASALDGELQVPVVALDSITSASGLVRVAHDLERQRVVALPPSGRVGTPKFTSSAGGTRVSLPVDRPDETVVVSRARARFRVRFGGLFTGTLPDTLDRGVVRSVRSIPTLGGSALEFEVDRGTRGFRLITASNPSRVILEFARGGAELERFAPEGPPGPRRLKVLVLDPGHGGTDPGTAAEGVREKDLSLTLALELAREVERRLPGTRVVLTRNRDVTVSQETRAEIANRSRADLVLSLHFDGFATEGARGATASCPPATFRSGADDDSSEEPVVANPRASLRILPWREVATRQAVPSRAFAEAVLSALELSGQGPTRLREYLPYGFLGVNAPGVVLDCATLSAASDRRRVTRPEGRRRLVEAIANGIVAWRGDR
ncbi:MAG: hypothetical protein HOP12_09830 [Candidatus Eisenbacteria bacterium]|uniref:MurNAc-LAA domain-containing protein n=1 Tax=Eiseniibacteriota bacterium TaxID=2212470 RepID=A0A849SR24_UNCEI|nr:hypothetical protein [Candidatus Eisenbacteria bacterium]